MTGQSDPDKRAAFLAALEYGVSPVVDTGYEKDPVRTARRPMKKRDRVKWQRFAKRLKENLRESA